MTVLKNIVANAEIQQALMTGCGQNAVLKRYSLSRDRFLQLFTCRRNSIFAKLYYDNNSQRSIARWGG